MIGELLDASALNPLPTRCRNSFRHTALLIMTFAAGGLLPRHVRAQTVATCTAWAGSPSHPNQNTAGCRLEIQDINHLVLTAPGGDVSLVRTSATPTIFTLEGEWASPNYPCPDAGVFNSETVEIKQAGLTFVATKIVGDACVTSGHVSFYGTLFSFLTLTGATTTDGQTVSIDYTVSATGLSSPVQFDVFRSTTADTTFINILSTVVGDSHSLEQGAHTLTLTPSSGLPPNTAIPYVVVVASYAGGKSTTYFHKFLLGVISHGFNRYYLKSMILAPARWIWGGLPEWETRMADALRTIDGYDDSIAFDWLQICADRKPGMAVTAGSELATMVAQHMVTLRKHSGDVVDLHFIGHSRGSVVVTQALKDLQTSTSTLGGSYIEVTLLDPHPANDNFEVPWASFARDAAGRITFAAASARRASDYFQLIAEDPAVGVAKGVRQVEVWYQHTPAKCLGARPYEENIMNLWGMVGPKALINNSNVPFTPQNKGTPSTGPTCNGGNGIGHNEIPEEYEKQVVESGTLNRTTTQ